MKKALVVLSALALFAAIIGAAFLLFWDREGVSTSAARPWAGKMGRLDAIPDRFPPLQPNDAAQRLTALANALPKTDAVDAFVGKEIVRAERTIPEPPPLVSSAPFRDLLLREKIVWERNEGIGEPGDEAMRALQMTIARLLVASALRKARTNDPAAWDDLHAVWKLARSLDDYPQMMLQTAALSMARMVNAVAWKMPLPAPAWFAELQQRDVVQPLLDSFQYQTASYWEDGSVFPTKWLAASVEHDRLIAEELSKKRECEVVVRMNELGTDLSSVWRRAFRYRAEREATANALRIRQHQPVTTTSGCTDGAWSYDGATLRFNREIALAAPDKAMPLVLHVQGD